MKNPVGSGNDARVKFWRHGHTNPVSHPDLVRLRQWIDDLASTLDDQIADPNRLASKKQTKRHRKRLKQVQATMAATSTDGGKDQLRGLIAAGVVRCGIGLATLDSQPAPELMTLEIVTFALWPIVVASRLPDSWYDDLQEITSPSVARLVAHARLSTTSGDGPSAQRFSAALAHTPYAFGARNLIADLSDPKRGAAALTAVAVASSLGEPPQRRSGPAFVAWLLGAAAAGVIGNRTDAVALDVWGWIERNSDGSGDRSEANSNSGGSDGDPFGHGAGNAHHSAGLLGILDDLF